MKLSEMLNYCAAQYLDDRTDLVDGSSDKLWSDDFLVKNFNEAQRLIARASWCLIEEGVSPAGLVTLATGIATYPIHQSVLRVLLVTPTDQEWPLFHTSDYKLRAPRAFDDGPFDVNSTAFSAPGRPLAFSTDAASRVMRIFRTPSVTVNGLQLALKVARLPITWLDVGNPDAEPEIPSDYHLQLCEYAAGKALTLPNVDGAQKADGRLLITAFTEQCKDARRDRQRAEMQPATWGFDTSTSLLGGQGSR